MRTIFLAVFLWSIGANTAENCLEISEKQMQEWKNLKPEMTSFGDLIKGKKLIDSERAFSLKLRSDKRAHCYLGCRLAEDINLGTAKFIAWQKEYSDATDCNLKTHFETADYEATLTGAVQGQTQKGLCLKMCKKWY